MKRQFLSAPLALLWLLLINLAAAAQSDPPKFEIGLHVSTVENGIFDSTSLGGGVRFTFNLNKMIALEGEVNAFNRADFGDVIRVQGLAGVKGGWRSDKFGVFGKARPGVVHSTLTAILNAPCHTFVQPSGSTLPGCQFGKTDRNDFAFDLGGVAEYYPTRRLVLRFDIGDTIIRQSLPDVIIPPSPAPGSVLLPAPDRVSTKHNLQINAGVGFRF